MAQDCGRELGSQVLSGKLGLPHRAAVGNSTARTLHGNWACPRTVLGN